MIFEEKEITLKDGRCAVLRSPCGNDAEGVLNLMREASGETEFLVKYPEEWTMSVSDEAKWLENSRSSPYGQNIICIIDEKIVGNCGITFGRGIKQGHIASLGIVIFREYWGLGIGSALIGAVIRSAEERGCEMIELSYIEGNDRGRRLYEKFGFTVVAEIPERYRLRDGTYRSEFVMQKHLK